MSPFLSLSITVFIALLLRKYVTSRRQPPYPPGPKPKPIIGNALDLPTIDLANVYVAWGKKYNSSIIHASAFGRHVLVLNNLEDAEELLEKRAAMYSDRPVFPIQKLMSMEHNVGFMRYGVVWRYHRKIMQQIFRKDAVKDYHSIMLQKVHTMLYGLLKSPEKFQEHNKMISVGIPMKAMYGYDVESVNDSCVAGADKKVTMTTRLFKPGETLINSFPILAFIPAWFPGASSHKIAAEVKRLTDELIRFPMDWAKKRMREGTASPSFVTNFLEKKSMNGASAQEEKAVEDIAYTVYAAATDTINSSIGSFFYYMAITPDVQEKAQTEIDRVIGRNRLPEIYDRPKLPYLEGIYREVLRCKPALHLGGPHSLTEDDYYKGYFIPKGTTVFGNIWAMTHDESVFPDPFVFKPERYFDENGVPNDDRILAYGFGRRICVGKHVASETLWLTFASILASFDIQKARDASGKEIAINDEYIAFGHLHLKKPFECSIKPRSREHRQLIEEANVSSG